MAKQSMDEIEFKVCNGNVFAGLGLPDAEQTKIKSGLAIEITRAVRPLGLTQTEAGQCMGISPRSPACCVEISPTSPGVNGRSV
jgi:predicted XRE-type DNA-binding protein